MNGLHSCKPENTPTVGQVKSFVVIQMPATREKKAWTKIKSAGAEQGGTPFKITAVKPTGFTDSHGNVSFNLDIEPAGAQEGTTPSTTASPARQNGGGSTYGGRSPETQARIERQHSQEMAIRYCTMVGGLPKMTEEMSDTDRLRFMIDFFQRDIGRDPTVKTKPEPTQQAEGFRDDDEPPF